MIITNLNHCKNKTEKSSYSLNISDIIFVFTQIPISQLISNEPNLQPDLQKMVNVK